MPPKQYQDRSIVEPILRAGQEAIVWRLEGPQCYKIPDEIPNGAGVKCISFQPGYWTVEYEGKEFTIFMGCVHDRSVEPFFRPRKSIVP